MFNSAEIIETITMIEHEHLDIRATTIGINLMDCISEDIDKLNENIYNKIVDKAGTLVKTAETVSKKYGIPIVTKRVSVTPIGSIIGSAIKNLEQEDAINCCVEVGKTLDKAAKDINIDFIGGYSALVQKGMTKGELALIESIPLMMKETSTVCSSINVASTKAGINLDAVKKMGEIIKETATTTKDALGCAKLVVFANAPEDNPFMAGAFHGVGEGDAVLNVGVSGPGVVRATVARLDNKDIGTVCNEIKKTAYKITRMGELIGREVANDLNIPFGIVDLSLAPTPAPGDSIANILEEIGLERCGTHGTTAALALLNDAVKKGGAMAASYVGGLSGSFIPVSEDAGMIRAVNDGALSIDKLEAMTCVCSVGLDMIAIPGKTPASTISAIIADEMAIGMVNKKTTAVRVIPVPGKDVGDFVEYGGLLGTAPIMPVNEYSSEEFINRGGRIPAPIQSMLN
ncbi:PFL family protein [Methanococcus aeolicus]|uniref:PFL family protein n=1 Tax=Methanococcus aeolicus TaxID=42879 RepID=UPI0021C98D00|nr:PFL family protein [Methanococcus aeolicus]UXM84985.1 PFL family protein [Methanococcus aeolicus]